jgi:hypothetical protein
MTHRRQNCIVTILARFVSETRLSDKHFVHSHGRRSSTLTETCSIMDCNIGRSMELRAFRNIVKKQSYFDATKALYIAIRCRLPALLVISPSSDLQLEAVYQEINNCSRECVPRKSKHCNLIEAGRRSIFACRCRISRNESICFQLRCCGGSHIAELCAIAVSLLWIEELTCVFKFAIILSKLITERARKTFHRTNHLYFTILEAKGWGNRRQIVIIIIIGKVAIYYAQPAMEDCQICLYC